MTPSSSMSGGCFTLEPVLHRTMTSQVTDRLVGLIASGQLKPGDVLPTERELAEQLHVGRTTVREALKHLTLAGLLEAKRGSGTTVSRDLNNNVLGQLGWSLVLSANEVRDLFELRQSVEVLAARLAAQRATPDEIGRIAIHREMRNVDRRDIVRQTELDLAFHIAVAEGSHNKLLLRVMRSMNDLLRRYVAQSIRMTEDMATTHAEHEAVFRAIEAHDSEAAVQAMNAHLDVSYRLAALMPSQTGSNGKGAQ